MRRIYNETDYIIMGKSHIQNMADARWSSSGTQFNSDHWIVLTHFQVQWSKLYHKKPKQFCTSKFNTKKLNERIVPTNSDKIKLSTLEENQSLTFPNIKNAITEWAKESLGFKEPNRIRNKLDDQLQ